MYFSTCTFKFLLTVRVTKQHMLHPCYVKYIIIYLELGILGGLVTPTCSYVLSESIVCHSTVV